MSLTDDFTRAAHAEAEDRHPPTHRNVPMYSLVDVREREAAAFVAGAEWARDYLTAQKPDVQHLWRPGASLSAFCGDEAAQPLWPVTREESLAVPVCALCHRRAMHEAHDRWAARQDPTDAEVLAAVNEYGRHTPIRNLDRPSAYLCSCEAQGLWRSGGHDQHRMLAALIAARDAWIGDGDGA